MDFHNIIIVGSGPAGTSAALQLSGEDVLMLDVGIEAPSIPSDFSGNLYQLRREHADLFPHLVGNDFQSMRNLFSSKKMSIKLKAPYLDYIIRDSETLLPISSESFAGSVSFSKGGLANGWGAGVIRYTDDDLRPFPITYGDLAPFYDVLTEHIGISGENDDLEEWFQHDDNLQPSLELNPFMKALFHQYAKHRDRLNAKKFFMGRPRVAVLSCEKDGRASYQYDHMDFFRSQIPAIYTPTYTLDKLIADKKISYKSGYLVDEYREESDRIAVNARNVSTGEMKTFYCRRLVLGAGALGTTRIVLRSSHDQKSILPFLDNPMACVPMFRPALIGRSIGGKDASAGQLNCVYSSESSDAPVLVVMISGNGSLRSDLIFETPLPAKVARAVLRNTAFAMGMGIIFFPCPQTPENNVSLSHDGALKINVKDISHPVIEKEITKIFSSMGFLCHKGIVQRPAMGSGLHFAGMLPMKSAPGPYQCNSEGLLYGTRGVYIVDGANFSALPAKNLTFTIMANAMRIARKLSA